MLELTLNLIFLFLSYLLGSFSFSHYITLKKAGIDIRNCGSQTAGARNASRILGKSYFYIIGISDLLKGYLVVFFSYSANLSFEIVLLCAISSVLGHIFPYYLSFRGGKGICTAFGAILGLSYKIALIQLFSFFIFTRFINNKSKAAILSFFTNGIWFLVIRDYYSVYNFNLVIFSILITIILVFTHKNNLKETVND